MKTKLVSVIRAALASLKAGSWPTAVAFLVTLAGTAGVLDTGEVTNIKVAVTALINLAAAGAAVVHGVHVHKLTAATAAAAVRATAAKLAADLLAGAKAEAATTAPAVTAAPVAPEPPASSPAA